MRSLVAILVLLPAAALAETPMTGPEFADHMTGKTLTFSANGQPYGAEFYAPSQRVIWSFLDGECIQGEWYAEGRAICFVYDGDPEPKCWEVYKEDSGIRAEFLNDPDTTILYEVEEAKPLICDNMGS
ncbi:MAG: hypothetical protein RI538_00220 [Salibaculum sp.]|jgi:hypothetical protein|uniref:hypothetical protein n=1 Tax=Roseovarius halophilus (ex Wu et al. 2025) TaxID=3376060 RepID=UPI00287078FC|nr:hypothetical protein [Salibaculum sp.]MDR9426529.1 hypothetical protein [Salibaculum sp.]MDR9481190.1 hypothetical protein [Salibaculum sp.]